MTDDAANRKCRGFTVITNLSLQVEIDAGALKPIWSGEKQTHASSLRRLA
jgi:hypothetical protein